MTQGLLAAALAAGVVLGVLNPPARADTEKVLNVYNRADYIGQRTIEQFEQATGIKVNYEVYGSRAMLETKLLAGQGSYDVVILPASLVAKLALPACFHSLDKSCRRERQFRQRRDAGDGRARHGEARPARQSRHLSPDAVIANSFPVRPMPPTAERLGARSWSRIKIGE